MRALVNFRSPVVVTGRRGPCLTGRRVDRPDLTVLSFIARRNRGRAFWRTSAPIVAPYAAHHGLPPGFCKAPRSRMSGYSPIPEVARLSGFDGKPPFNGRHPVPQTWSGPMVRSRPHKQSYCHCLAAPGPNYACFSVSAPERAPSQCSC